MTWIWKRKPNGRMPHLSECTLDLMQHTPSSRRRTPFRPNRNTDRIFWDFSTKTQVFQWLAYWVLLLCYHRCINEISKPKSNISISKSKKTQKCKNGGNGIYTLRFCALREIFSSSWKRIVMSSSWASSYIHWFIEKWSLTGHNYMFTPAVEELVLL